MTHLSMVAPVPDAHLSFIEVMAVLSPVSSFFLKMMILASCPPSSTTEPTSGCSFSTASVTALTSCTNFAPMCGAERRRARAGDERADLLALEVGERLADALQELGHALGLLGLVALVVAPEDLRR